MVITKQEVKTTYDIRFTFAEFLEIAHTTTVWRRTVTPALSKMSTLTSFLAVKQLQRVLSSSFS